MKCSKIIAALLCAVMLAAAALPALADERAYRYGSTTGTLSSIGVSVLYEAEFSGKKATADFTLTYLPDPSNHLPSNDYTTKAIMEMQDYNGGYTYYNPWQHQVGMTGHFTCNTASGLSVSSALYYYYVNGTYRTYLSLSV